MGAFDVHITKRLLMILPIVGFQVKWYDMIPYKNAAPGCGQGGGCGHLRGTGGGGGLPGGGGGQVGTVSPT